MLPFANHLARGLAGFALMTAGVHCAADPGASVGIRNASHDAWEVQVAGKHLPGLLSCDEFPGPRREQEKAEQRIMVDDEILEQLGGIHAIAVKPGKDLYITLDHADNKAKEEIRLWLVRPGNVAPEQAECSLLFTSDRTGDKPTAMIQGHSAPAGRELPFGIKVYSAAGLALVPPGTPGTIKLPEAKDAEPSADLSGAKPQTAGSPEDSLDLLAKDARATGTSKN